MTEFTIPFEICDLNTYIAAERINRFKAAKVKKELTESLGWYCKKLNLAECQYDIEIEWTTKDKRKDSDNIFFGVKFILDAMVKVGTLKNDSYRFVRNISNKRLIGKPQINVKFIPVE